jgi:hypothetical protein
MPSGNPDLKSSFLLLADKKGTFLVKASQTCVYNQGDQIWPVEWLFSKGVFLIIAEVYKKIWGYIFHGKSYEIEIILTTNGLGNILGDFFHKIIWSPWSQLTLKRPKFVAAKDRFVWRQGFCSLSRFEPTSLSNATQGPNHGFKWNSNCFDKAGAQHVLPRVARLSWYTIPKCEKNICTELPLNYQMAINCAWFP